MDLHFQGRGLKVDFRIAPRVIIGFLMIITGTFAGYERIAGILVPALRTYRW